MNIHTSSRRLTACLRIYNKYWYQKNEHTSLKKKKSSTINTKRNTLHSSKMYNAAMVGWWCWHVKFVCCLEGTTRGNWNTRLVLILVYAVVQEAGTSTQLIGLFFFSSSSLYNLAYNGISNWEDKKWTLGTFLYIWRWGTCYTFLPTGITRLKPETLVITGTELSIVWCKNRNPALMECMLGMRFSVSML